MSTWAIGDLQGCFDPLETLLERCGFDRRRDRLWFVGDLINRGPKSLETLRFVRDLGDAAVTVLGNHDLSLLMIAAGHGKLHRLDTFHHVLDAPDRDELVDWLPLNRLNRARISRNRTTQNAMFRALPTKSLLIPPQGQ